MVLSPRQLAIRVFIWGGVLTWAVWELRSMDDVEVDLLAVSESTPLPRPASVSPPGDGDWMALLEEVRAGAGGCGLSGNYRLKIRIGGSGLAAASLVGPSPDPAVLACLGTLVWSRPWPAATVEVEWPLGS